ncbi:MAG TPA: SpoIIE family protein phosphatase [Solirubrobacteraceae bacterium]|nr:SpoIIE family protein phosphatase [Solirubrobacteraceae bacterium]
MTAAGGVDDTTEDFFEDAPIGYVSTTPEGTIIRVNRTFEAWTGRSRGDLVGARRFQELLSPGGRIFYETHCGPLLRIQGWLREIALDVVRADGSILTTLVNSTLRPAAAGRPEVVNTSVFDATERRRYERDLLAARRREEEIARRLQRSMLSGDLPAGAGLDIAVAYHPGVRGLEVGGDWYDAFWLTDGETAGIVVGDVVGRGLHAAAAMGQLRSAVRALASTGLGPGPLLERLDAYARRHGVGRMATVVYAELDLESLHLRLACAGHPPPLIATPGEAARFVWDGRSPPLAAHRPGAAGRQEATVRLTRGSTVLLYTDGLVERRSSPLAEGMDRLRAEFELARGEDATTLTGRLSRGLHSAEHDDDVCLLAVHLAV